MAEEKTAAAKCCQCKEEAIQLFYSSAKPSDGYCQKCWRRSRQSYFGAALAEEKTL